MPSVFKLHVLLQFRNRCMYFLYLQDETVTIETVFPFDVSVKFVSTKVCPVKPVEIIWVIEINRKIRMD